MGRTGGLEANGRGPTRETPAHRTLVVLGSRGRASHQWESTSTALKAKLDTPTCSTQDLVAQHVPTVSHTQLLLPEDLCLMDQETQQTLEDFWWKRLPDLSFTQAGFGGPLYFGFTEAGDASNTEGNTTEQETCRKTISKEKKKKQVSFQIIRVEDGRTYKRCKNSKN